MPMNCVDLNKFGHLKKGFYTVKEGPNRTITVYCDFTKLTPENTGGAGATALFYLLMRCNNK